MFAPALERAAFVVPPLPAAQAMPGSGTTTTGRRLSQVHAWTARDLHGRPRVEKKNRVTLRPNMLPFCAHRPTSKFTIARAMQTTNLIAAAPALELVAVPALATTAPLTTGTEAMPATGTTGTGRRLQQASMRGGAGDSGACTKVVAAHACGQRTPASIFGRLVGF